MLVSAIHDFLMMDDHQISEIETRCGYAAVVGRPNAGKSTLLNRVLSEKLSIVTAKPQTTRNRILAVHNEGRVQVIFLDTPGLHYPRDTLGRYMVETAESAIKESDVCVWLIDVGEPKRPRGLTTMEKEIGEQLSRLDRPVLALLNKIDLIKDKSCLLPLIEAAAQIPSIEEVIPISAESGDGVDFFLEQLICRMPPGPKLYPEDMLSEQAERFFVAEIIREALTELTHKEVPYHSAVVIDKFVEEMHRTSIYATIHVERASQRKIVVGSKGSMIKQIGQRARQAAERFLGCPVELLLHVDVSPGWTRNTKDLKKMGYE
ncbi:MAG: GTPase Era [Proteobacteria bacterium]|nr:GTPase Era [Pseudomonadota bacterium]